MTTVAAVFREAGLPEGEPLDTSFDDAFFEPSVGALLDDAILEPVRYLRSGGRYAAAAEI